MAGLAATVALSGLWASSVAAQTPASSERVDSTWGLGIGVIATDKPYRNFKTESTGLPLISYENKWISASVPTFDVKLFNGETLSLRLRTRYAGDGYEADDSPFLAGMKERKSSLWAGGAVIWKTNVANFTGELSADAMGKSKGTRARLQVDRRLAVGRFGFTPRLAAEWVDDKYVDYYFGVRQSEATATRAFYEGKSTVIIHTGLRMDYTPALHHVVFLDLGFSRFGSQVKDSPLVDKPNRTSIGLGYAYRF